MAMHPPLISSQEAPETKSVALASSKVERHRLPQQSRASFSSPTAGLKNSHFETEHNAKSPRSPRSERMAPTVSLEAMQDVLSYGTGSASRALQPKTGAPYPPSLSYFTATQAARLLGNACRAYPQKVGVEGTKTWKRKDQNAPKAAENGHLMHAGLARERRWLAGRLLPYPAQGKAPVCSLRGARERAHSFWPICQVFFNALKELKSRTLMKLLDPGNHEITLFPLPLLPSSPFPNKPAAAQDR